MLSRLSLSVILVLLALPVTGFTQTPSISVLTPTGFTPGSPIQVKVTGGNLAGAKQLWTTFGSFELTPDIAENGTKANEATFTVTVPAELPPGIVGVRVLTDKGVSPLKFAVIDPLPVIAHANNNKSWETAQSITVPAAVEGHVDNLSRLYFRFPVTAGQVLSFEVQARRIGSVLDPMLRLLSPSGSELAWSDDEPGLQGDCLFRHEFKEAGDYTLELSDIRYQGGGNHRFRLRIGDFHLVNSIYPLIRATGDLKPLSLVGKDVPAEPIANFLLDWHPPEEELATTGWIAGIRAWDANDPRLATTVFPPFGMVLKPQFLETEPNDTAEQANRVELGTHLNGRFETKADVDRFIFTAKKGQKYRFSAITREAGSPSDLYLKLLKPDGSQLAVAEDVGLDDGTLDFTAPEDGDYTLLVSDLHERGGSEFSWHVSVDEIAPGFSISSAAEAINVPAGGIEAVTINAKRSGYGGTIRVEARNLPEGITSLPTYIGPGRNDAVLTLSATKEVPAGQLREIKIFGIAEIGGKEFFTLADTHETLKAAHNALPWPPRNLIHSIAAAAAPEPPVSLKIEPAEVVIGQHLSTKFKVLAERKEGWDADIALAINPAKNGLPKGIAINVSPIKNGSNELELTISADQNAALGEFTAAVTGTIKKDKETATPPLPGITIKVQAPLSVSVEPATGTIAKGGELKLKVSIARNPALSAPVVLSAVNLPAGVTAEAVTIPTDQTEAEFVLKAAADAAPADVKNLQIKAEATVGDKKLPGNSPNLSLKVE